MYLYTFFLQTPTLYEWVQNKTAFLPEEDVFLTRQHMLISISPIVQISTADCDDETATKKMKVFTPPKYGQNNL